MTRRVRARGVPPKRKGRPRTFSSVAVTAEIAYCDVHRKKSFLSRRDARESAKRVHPGDHLSPYECDQVDGRWHYGHLSEGQIRGER